MTNTLMKKVSRLACLAPFAVACSGDKGEDATEQVVDSREYREENLQEPIHVIALVEEANGDITRTPREYSWIELRDHLLGVCDSGILKEGESQNLCEARLYMEAAGVRDEPLYLAPYSGKPAVEIPTQDVYSRVTLAEGAFREVRDALFELSNEIVWEASSDPEYANYAAYEEATRQRIGGYLEATALVGEAMDLSIATKLAAGDAVRTSPSISENAIQTASYRRWAARKLLPDTHNSVRNPPPSCTARAPEGAVGRALKVLRETAVSPAHVLDPELEIDAFLNAETAEEGGGSVRDRALLLGFPISGDVQSHFQLDTEDFVAARDYLAQEIDVYSRSLTASVTLESGLEWFGATATEPSTPGVYWVARERNTYGWPAPDSSPYAGDILASQYLSLVYALEELDSRTIALEISAENVFSSVLAQREDEGFYSLCASNSAPFLMGFEDSEDLLLLRGDDALRCATSGRIDGVPCSQAELNASTITGFEKSALEAADLEGLFGFPTTSKWDLLYESKWTASSTDPISRVDGERFYLVRRRAGRMDAVPGAYEAVTGVSNKCRGMYFPEYEKRAAEMLQPDPEWCSVPRVSCAGLEWSERIPLEDELSSDGDNVESSWRHYLALAEQAARESDELAKEYLQSGLELSLRNEDVELREEDRERIAQDRASQAIEELQEVCGSEIDPDRLLGLLRGQEDELSFVGPEATCSNAEPCSEGFDCIVGRCVRNIDALLDENQDIYPELNKIRSCIADESDSFVHLAQTDESRVLCVWHDQNDPNRICEETSPTALCPAVVALTDDQQEDPDGTCDSALNVPEGHVARAVTTGLGLIESDMSRMSALPTAGLECEAIRLLRANPGAPGLIDTISYGDKFDLRLFQDEEFLKDAARGLRFEADADDLGALYFGDEVLAQVRAGNTFPCTQEFSSDDEPASGCEEGNQGLFCMYRSCDTGEERAYPNWRLKTAVQAAQAMAGLNSATHVLPVGVAQTLSLSQFREGNSKLYFDAELQRFERAGIYTHGVWSPQNLETGPVKMDPARGYHFPAGGGMNLLVDTIPNAVGIGRLEHLGTWRSGKYESDGATDDSIWYLGFAETELNYSGGTSLLDGLSRNHSRRGPVLQYLRGEVGKGAIERWDDQVSSSPIYNLRHSSQAVLDGVELLCEARSRLAGPDVTSGICGTEVPSVNKISDFKRAEEFLRCIGDQMQRTTESIVLSKFPEEAKDPQRSDSLIGSFPALAGLSGADMSELRLNLIQLREAPRRVGDSLNDYADAMRGLRTAVFTHSNSAHADQIQLGSDYSSLFTACRVASSPGQTVGVSVGLSGVGMSYGVSYNPGAAVAQCANEAAQKNFARETAALREGLRNAQLEEAFASFEGSLADIARDLERHSDAFVGALETVDRQLGLVALQKSRARRALAKAVYVNSFESKYETKVSAEYLSRFEASRVRYQRAHLAAQKMAFLAKRAIETRIGHSLADMSEELPLVEPPATWEASLCATSPIDYSTLADGSGAYADQFIGDYVRKLSAVVESYRLVNNFQEGTDTAVVSLRDDVFNVRRVCEVESRNLLYHAESLSSVTTPDAPGWNSRGCALTEQRCIHVTETVATLDVPALGAPGGIYELDFGEGGTCVGEGCAYQSDPVLGVTNGSVLAQAVQLQPGQYRLSWYMDEDTAAADAAIVFGAEAEELPLGLGGASAGSDSQSLLANVQSEAATEGYLRYHGVFVVDEPQTVFVAFQVPESTGDFVIKVSSPMLEAYSGPATGEAATPPNFEPTGASRIVELPACPDDTGDVMRDRHWEWDSDYLCENGFSAGCSERGGERHFYWGSKFTITQGDLQDGRVLGSAGFARGNFNYRIESIALNIVGADVRDCESAASSATCYASSYLPFSLHHDGPYFVRNHGGEDYEAFLYPARIEWARALSGERYITNPIASSDLEMLSAFTRDELRGRPLDGEFSLRLWDTGEIDFEKLEDVQLIINYRYWTRSQ